MVSNTVADPLSRRAELESFASRLGIRLNDVSLLDRALTHASAVDDAGPRPNYEALEFVGDAALDLAITHRLYEQIPGRTPGEYSKMRAGIVNQRALARVAVRLEIAPVIDLGKGEERSGGRERKALLADCLESLIGALYLDQGWEATKAFVTQCFEEEVARAVGSDRIWDYKSRLQNYCQAERVDLPNFVLIGSAGPEHRKEFEVEVFVRDEAAGRGSGSTKKEAEQNAARVALVGAGQIPG